jgi:5-methylcytosine-specific restriction endonuclease McrA
MSIISNEDPCLKQCTKCNTFKPATLEFFCRKQKSASGLGYECKDCKSTIDKAAYLKNKERVIAKVKEYRDSLKLDPEKQEKAAVKRREWKRKDREANPEKYREYDRRLHWRLKESKGTYYERNKEAIDKYKKEWRQRNIGRLLVSQKEHYRNNKDRYRDWRDAYKKKNIEKLFSYHQKYRDRNKEKIAATNRAYRLATPEKQKVLSHRRRARKISQDDKTLNELAIKSLLAKAIKCPYCGKKYIEGSYTDSKTIDHLVPLCRGGLNSISNIIVCCRSCNSKKGKKSFPDWLDMLEEPFKAKSLKLYRKVVKCDPEQQLLPFKFI